MLSITTKVRGMIRRWVPAGTTSAGNVTMASRACAPVPARQVAVGAAASVAENRASAAAAGGPTGTGPGNVGQWPAAPGPGGSASVASIVGETSSARADVPVGGKPAEIAPAEPSASLPSMR